MLKEEALKKSIEFFNGDELAADVFIKKYAIIRPNGKYKESTPEHMWKRMAFAASQIEKNKEKWEKEFYNILKDFKVIPGGSIMFALGNKYAKSSLSNCFVFSVQDNIESIFDTAKEMARTYSYRGGCGLDLTPLRPADATVSNSAKFSSGAASFMQLYSDITRTIGMHGRRGALLLSMSVEHPDIELFIRMKHDLTKVTGANVSVRITDKFMNAVKNNDVWITKFETNHETIKKEFKAKELWKLICDSATKYAEPGVLFWDTIKKFNPSECYSEEGYGISGLNPCQPEFATIIKKEGISTIGNINIGDEIWSKEGWTKVINKWSTGIRKVYRYRTTRGVFYGTENHKVVSNGIKTEVKDAETIDSLAGPNTEKISLDKQSIMDGLVIGDGSVHEASNKKVYLYIGDNDKDYFDSEIKEFILRSNGIKRGTTFDIKTKILANELPYTYQRYVPERYKNANKNIIASFLKGLYSANGSICGQRVTLKSTSKQIIEDAQVMLNFLGINSYFTRNKPTLIKWKNGEYTSRESYDLNIGTDRNKFYNLIGFLQKYKNEKLKTLLDIKSLNKKQNNSDIVEKEYIADMEVFDITVNNKTHTYWTGCCDVSNCAELSLASGESCLLVNMNLAKYTKNDFSENSTFDFDSFKKDIYITTRFADNCKSIDAELVPLAKQKKACLDLRRIGLGITGLADCLANLGIKYDSDNAIKFTESIFKIYTKSAYEASVELGKEKGIFPVFNSKKEKGHYFLEKIGFAGVPRRNVALMTCPPTGSVSILSQCSSGIEPVFRNSYKRRVKITPNMSVKSTDKIFTDIVGEKYIEYEVFHHNVKRWMDMNPGKELPDYFITSDQIDWEKRIEMQSVISKNIDHSISSTINLPEGTTSDLVNKIYTEAWNQNLKGVTVYVDKSRDGILVTEEKKNCKPCSYKRPVKLPCDIYRITADGGKWLVMVGLKDGKPFEIFCGKPTVHIDEKHIRGYIEKESRGRYSLHIGENEILRDISKIFNDVQGALSRQISLNLRHDVDVLYIVQQLEKSDGNIFSFNHAIAKVLKKYIKDGIKENGQSCPNCGGDMVRQEGCVVCKNCGWSKCG